MKRLEQEMSVRAKDQQSLEAQYAAVERQIAEQAARDYDAEIVLRNLQDFRKMFIALAPQEKVKVLRCLVRDIIVCPDKLLLNIFELAKLTPGSQQRKDWLRSW